MFQRLLRSLSEALPGFDVSDTPVEKPQPVVKRPPPTPIAALKRGVRQPIKNKLPGVHGAPSADTVSALKAIKREDRQTFAGIVKEARVAVSEGVFDAVGAATKQLMHPINMVKKMAAGDLGRDYAAKNAKAMPGMDKGAVAATIKGHGFSVTNNATGKTSPGFEQDEEDMPKQKKMKESINSIRQVMEGGGSRATKAGRQMDYYNSQVPETRRNRPSYEPGGTLSKQALRGTARAIHNQSPDLLARRQRTKSFNDTASKTGALAIGGSKRPYPAEKWRDKRPSAKRKLDLPG